MRLDVSVGEAVDKLSILDLKFSRIQDERKRTAIRAELDALSDVRAIANASPLLYSLLFQTNQTIWDLTDQVKALDDTDPTYASLARQIFDENQTRFRIKTMLNTQSQSSLHEQKSYTESEITLLVTNPRIASSALWALALQYDIVFLDGECINLLLPMFRLPTFRVGKTTNRVLDTDISVQDIERRMPPPIRYAAGGRLGDFIHQLSVVYERYLQTGRRGCLYLGETNIGGDNFARGVASTIADISPLLQSLPYIQSIEPYTGQPYDVNLSAWRNVPSLYSKSWQQIYGDTYAVTWAAHAWLTSPIRSDLSDVILVCTTPARWTNSVRWDAFLASLPGKPMFLRISNDDYSHFSRATGLSLPCVDVSSFTDLVIAIHSCRKFIGTLSMPLAVADGLKKDRIAITIAGSEDESIASRTDSRFTNHF